MRFKYKILKEYNLLIQYYCGKITLSDLYNSTNIIGNDIDFEPTMFFLNDLRDSDIITDEKSIYELTEYIKNNKKLYAKRKTAFVTSTPNQVVFSTLITHLKNESLVNIEIVSSIEFALIHLLGDAKDYKLIDEIINELKLT